MSKSRSRNRRPQNWRTIVIAVGVLIFATCFCSIVAISVGGQVLDFFQTDTPDISQDASFSWDPDSAQLTVAVAPVMAPTLANRVEVFNSRGLSDARRADDEHRAHVAHAGRDCGTKSGPASLPGRRPRQFDLAQSDRSAVGADAGTEAGDIFPPRRRRVRFAISPIVLAAWEETARDLGWPDQPVGWGEIQRKATEDANFKWNHPSTQHAAGLLATLAEFYAGADLTRGLTEEIATRQDVLDYVRAVEATVRFYGEGEEVIVQRLAEEGQSFLDVFVAQEQTVIQWNTQRRGDRLVAIYPPKARCGPITRWRYSNWAAQIVCPSPTTSGARSKPSPSF
ncbi:MAG: substrate-binding domain-containing protein [Caldilineaceae bacterium]